MQILVLGATGFIGTALVQRLTEVGLRVRAAHRGVLPHAALGKARWIAIDLGDTESITAAAEGCDAVFHLAGYTLYPDAPLAPSLHTAMARQERILTALKQARVRRLIYTSCACTLGLPEHLATEHDEHLPTGLHPLPDIKLALEWSVLAANSLRMSTSVLLPTFAAGPGQRPTGLGALTHALAKGKLPALPTARINLVDVRDLAQAHLIALQRARPGQRYALASPTPVTLQDIAHEIAQHTSARPPRFELPEPASKAWLQRAAPLLSRSERVKPLLDLYETMRLMPVDVDCAKAKLELNFDPRHPLVTVQDSVSGG